VRYHAAVSSAEFSSCCLHRSSRINSRRISEARMPVRSSETKVPHPLLRRGSARRCCVTSSKSTPPSRCSSSNGETCRQSFRPAPVPSRSRSRQTRAASASRTAPPRPRGPTKLKPCREEVHPQHALHANRWPPVARLRVDRRDPRTQSRPGHDPVHLGQELCAPRGLRVLLEPRVGQRRAV